MTAPAPTPPAPQPVPPAAPDAPGTPTPPPAPPVPPVVPPGATVAQPGQQPDPNDLASASPDRLREMIAELRRENAGARVSRNAEQEQQTQAAIAAAVQKAQQDQATAIGKALGLIQDEEPVDPAKLTAQWAEKETGYQKQIRELTVASALSAALAGTHPGAKDALIGSGKLADLDPTAADFTTQLQTRVTEYLDANPYLKVTAPPPPPAGSSGADFTGSTPPPGGAPSIDDLRAERAKRRAG